MTEDEAVAQAQLREIVNGMITFGLALEGIHHRLPVPPQEDAMLQGKMPMTVALRMRTVIECVLHDQLRPAIEDLQSAASYRLPAEEQHAG